MTHIKQKINKQKGHDQTLPAHTIGMFWTIGTQPERCVEKNQNKASFSLCTTSGLAAAAPTDTCFPWQCCGARPQWQREGCPLHTRDLGDSQQTENNYTHAHSSIGNIPIDFCKKTMCSYKNLAATLNTKLKKPRSVSYRAIKECPHWGRRLYLMMTA